MNQALCAEAQHMRALLASGRATPEVFRAALTAIAPHERDAWLDCVLELGELPDDDASLPPGCAPYLPCAVDTLLCAVDCAEVQASDVVVDVGAGVGRAAAAIHLLTGASAIGLEIQPDLARRARELGARVNASRLEVVEGDAAQLTDRMAVGSVFFLYCPFSGGRLQQVLTGLSAIARARQIRVCCVDLPLPKCDWLAPVAVPRTEIAVYRSAAPGFACV